MFNAVIVQLFNSKIVNLLEIENWKLKNASKARFARLTGELLFTYN